MMAKNPHFRILALTATPGSNVEAVQTLIDGLHISRIEIRDERELARYNHEKVYLVSCIPYPDPCANELSENRTAYYSNDSRGYQNQRFACQVYGCMCRPFVSSCSFI
jgi:hypothetical protein